MNQTLIQPFVLETYGLSIQSLEPVTNEMFRCTGNGSVFYLRISQYKTLLEQQAELSWIYYLSAANVGVPHIVPSISNQLVVPFADDPSYAVVLFHSAPGVHLPRQQWDASVFYALGKQIGRMHKASQTFLASGSTPIPHWYESSEYQFLEHILYRKQPFNPLQNNCWMKYMRFQNMVPTMASSMAIFGLKIFWCINVPIVCR